MLWLCFSSVIISMIRQLTEECQLASRALVIHVCLSSSLSFKHYLSLSESTIKLYVKPLVKQDVQTGNCSGCSTVREFRTTTAAATFLPHFHKDNGKESAPIVCQLLFCSPVTQGLCQLSTIQSHLKRQSQPWGMYSSNREESEEIVIRNAKSWSMLLSCVTSSVFLQTLCIYINCFIAHAYCITGIIFYSASCLTGICILSS